jgi:hypothetical protein
MEMGGVYDGVHYSNGVGSFVCGFSNWKFIYLSMAQEIITYTIVLAALIVSAVKFYRSVLAKNKSGGSCGGCSGCGDGGCSTK